MNSPHRLSNSRKPTLERAASHPVDTGSQHNLANPQALRGSIRLKVRSTMMDPTFAARLRQMRDLLEAR
jgi:hypothetical protein